MESLERYRKGFFTMLVNLYKVNDGSLECLQLIEDCIDSLRELNQLLIDSLISETFEIQESDLHEIAENAIDTERYYKIFINNLK